MTNEASADNIRFCPECGKEITQLSKFCPHCGHSLEKFASQSKSDASLQILVDEDDFNAFIGNNAGYYTHEFKKFDAGGRDVFSATWNWAAFWGGFGWMLYRKMYMWAIIAFALMLMPYLGLAAWIAFGIVGNYLYYQHAKAKILDIKTLHPTGEISAALSQIGGVHRWLPIAATILTILIFLSFVALVFWFPFAISNLFKMPSMYI
jgi:hypothetical protein